MKTSQTIYYCDICRETATAPVGWFNITSLRREMKKTQKTIQEIMPCKEQQIACRHCAFTIHTVLTWAQIHFEFYDPEPAAPFIMGRIFVP